MSAITPQTELRLLKCPIEEDNKNQLKFSSATAQYNYFNSLDNITVDNFTYQRKDNVIRYPAHIDSIINYNYVMYQNEAYTNKWFYAFITNMEYVNDHLTYITIKTDVFQTWQFDIIYKRCYVEREHVNDDSKGLHTVPENLETGEYIIDYSTDFSSIGTSHIVMASNINPSDGTSPVGGGTYGGIYSGLSYYLFQSNTDLNNALIRMSNEGTTSSIEGLFYLPDWITNYNTTSFDANGVGKISNTSKVTNATGIAIPLKPSVLGSYTPKNNKLFTYPYCYYSLSNNSGSSIEYHLEDFYDTGDHTGKIKVVGSACIGGSIRAIPVNYKSSGSTSLGDNNEYGLNLGKFPSISYSTNTFNSWYRQNGLNVGLNIASSLINSGINLDTVPNSINEIGSTLLEVRRHTFTPIEAQGNINAGDITFSDGKLTFTGYFVTIKPEYAKIIDDYFSMFGYKVNSLKIPNITGRTNWNYVKTIDCNFEGNIPQSDLNEIRNMFNSGITLWHNTSNYLDYSKSNTIVT